jgi:probable Rubsico expression protein CbbX
MTMTSATADLSVHEPTVKPDMPSVDLVALFRESTVGDVLAELDRDLVGLTPVKTRIREIAAQLLVERARETLGIASGAPTLHMCFSGNPGTGKTTVALRMADVLFRLGYIRRKHLVSVTRDDLVGQYIGHTAPKTRDVLKRAMGGVLFIDEAYYLYRPENERDYGQEAIEILLQTMENQRSDLVVILAGYESRMETFFQSNPGFRSRIAHHVTFPDYDVAELIEIAEGMLARMHYRLDAEARAAFEEYLARRIRQPNFANARSVRNALDRARLRQASRIFADAMQGGGPSDTAALTLLSATDIRASRVFDTPPPRPV